MKELKYNIKLLLKRKELYFSIICILLVNLIHIFLTIHYNSSTQLLVENQYSAEYLAILYSVDVNLDMLIIIIFPILCATIFSDSSLFEKKEKISTILHCRLNKKKLILTRFLTIIVSVFLISFVGFLMNYISLICIYGSGNAVTYFQSPAFYLIGNTNIFLDTLRLSNPILFYICITAHVSFLISLLSGLAYSISFFVKQKIWVYVSPFVVLLASEFILSSLKLEQYAPITQLQPFSFFNFTNAAILYLSFLIIYIIFIIIHLKKRDNI